MRAFPARSRMTGLIRPRSDALSVPAWACRNEMSRPGAIRPALRMNRAVDRTELVSNSQGQSGEGKASRAGYVRIPRAILERRDITATAKLVWATIADRLGKTGESWPGIRRIADDVGIGDPSNVLPHIDALEAAGVLIVERRKGPGGTNLYRLPRAGESTSLLKRQRAVDLPARAGKSTARRAVKTPAKPIPNNLSPEPVPGLRPAEAPGTIEPGPPASPADPPASGATDLLGEPVTTQPKGSAPRDPDPIFDLLAELFWPGGLTERAPARIGKAKKYLLPIMTNLGATNHDIERVHDELKRKWDGRSFSIEKFVEWFGDTFRGLGKARSGTDQPGRYRRGDPSRFAGLAVNALPAGRPGEAPADPVAGRGPGARSA